MRILEIIIQFIISIIISIIYNVLCSGVLEYYRMGHLVNKVWSYYPLNYLFNSTTL